MKQTRLKHTKIQNGNPGSVYKSSEKRGASGSHSFPGSGRTPSLKYFRITSLVQLDGCGILVCYNFRVSAQRFFPTDDMGGEVRKLTP